MVADALSKKTVATMSLQHGEWRLADDGAISAQLEAQPILKKMIIDAQKNDEEVQKKLQIIRVVTRPNFQ